MTNYYVDAIVGNDANAGNSPNRAWKTISRVNAAMLAPGDQVLFHRGQTWSGSQLTIGWSGTLDAPITLAAYAAGERPILDAQRRSDVNTIRNTGHSHLVLRDLDLRNGYSSCIYTDGLKAPITNIDIINCSCSGAGNDNILFIHNCSNVRIIGVECFRATDAFPNQVSTGIEIADGGSGFLIDSCMIHDCPTGISIHCHPPSALYPEGFNLPTQVFISNTQVYHIVRTGYRASGSGIQVANGLPNTSQHYGKSRISISDCVVSGVEIPGSGIAFGKDIYGAANMHGQITVRRCVVSDCDFYNYDIDGADDVTLRRCLSHQGANVHDRGIRIRNAQRIGLYHLTCHASTNNGSPLILIDQRNTETTEFTDDIVVRNCILASPNVGAQMIKVDTASFTDLKGDTIPKKFDIDHNLYQPSHGVWFWKSDTAQLTGLGNWQRASGQDAASSATNMSPFVDAAGGNFGLYPGSPAIDAGILLPGVNDASAGRGPDLGYVELVHIAPRAYVFG